MGYSCQVSDKRREAANFAHCCRGRIVPDKVLRITSTSELHLNSAHFALLADNIRMNRP